jgi:hypothetical protein
MQFHLPNFEDIVDPGFDFDIDSYSPKRKNRWVHRSIVLPTLEKRHGTLAMGLAPV